MYNVIGWQRGSFIAKDTGDRISYGKIFVSKEIKKYDDNSDMEFIGQAVEAFKVKPHLLDNIMVGDNVSFYFDSRGKITVINIE